MAVMRRHMLELGWLYSKTCVKETQWPVMGLGKNNIINQNDVKVSLNVIH